MAIKTFLNSFLCLLLVSVSMAAPMQKQELEQKIDLYIAENTLSAQAEHLDLDRWPKILRRFFADSAIRNLANGLKSNGYLKLDPATERQSYLSDDLRMTYIESIGNEPILIVSFWALVDPDTHEYLPLFDSQKNLSLFRSMMKDLQSNFKKGYRPKITGSLHDGDEIRDFHFEFHDSVSGVRMIRSQGPSPRLVQYLKDLGGRSSCQMVFAP